MPTESKPRQRVRVRLDFTVDVPDDDGVLPGWLHIGTFAAGVQTRLTEGEIEGPVHLLAGATSRIELVVCKKCKQRGCATCVPHDA